MYDAADLKPIYFYLLQLQP